MRSQLDSREPVARGLRRLARRHARAAKALLEGERPLTGRTIHAVRKRIKRLRAISMLAEGAGARGLGRDRRRIADAGAWLSTMRDLDVMEETLNALSAGEPQLISTSGRRAIKRQLHMERHDLRRNCRKGKTVTALTRALTRLADRMAAWHPRTSSPAICIPGLTRAHERACKALQLALRGDDARFHTLRKRLTALRNQLLVVAPVDSGPYKDAVALDAAIACLGDDHNLTVLSERLVRWAAEGLISLDAQALRRGITRRQRSLRKQALAVVRPVCSVPTGLYVQRLEAAWEHTGDSRG